MEERVRYTRVLREQQAIEIDVPEVERRREQLVEIAQRLVKLVRDEKIAIPMLPSAASEVLALANNPGASVREIEGVVRGDPMLAARVLAVANSSMYGSTKVGSLGNALSRLGAGAIRDVLFQAVAHSHIFRDKSLAAELRHGVAVARISTLLCTQLGIPKGHAFICGLLHDLGRPIIFDLLAQMRETLTKQEADLIATRGHAVVGSQVAARWKLPSLVEEVCRHHHSYRDEKTGRYSQLGNIVAVADRVAEHLGLGRRVRQIDYSKERCFFDVGLDASSAMLLVQTASELDL